MKKTCLNPLTVLLGFTLSFLPMPARADVGDSWKRKANMPTPRQVQTCVVNGKIFALGGVLVGEGAALSTVEEYDPAADGWTARADMPTARHLFACGAVAGKIYAIGGDSTFLTSPLTTVEEFDPAANEWTGRTGMPTARSGCAAAVVDGKIYVIGGLTTFGAAGLSTVEAYDPVKDFWTKRAPMPTRRGLLCACVVDGKIYAIGASLPPNGPWLATMEMYDPATDTWTRQPGMPTARGALACSAVHGRIYVLGGRNCCTGFSTVEEFDPLTSKWTKRADIRLGPTGNPIGRFVFGANEIGGRIYVVGGASIVSDSRGSSAVLEYTPPVVPPALRMKSVIERGQIALHLEWLGHPDYVDSLQVRSQFDAELWTEFGKFDGTGTPSVQQIPPAQPAAFYRLQRELR